jgi:hypothetical protein
MLEKAKAFYEKNKPVVTKVVFTVVGGALGVLAVIAIAVLVDEPETFDPNLQKEYTTEDGETKIYNPFDDPATGLS